jgi:hypothetical protein
MATRPSPRVRAKATTSAVWSASVRVAPVISVMLPVSGRGLRPWPRKSKVTAM